LSVIRIPIFADLSKCQIAIIALVVLVIWPLITSGFSFFLAGTAKTQAWVDDSGTPVSQPNILRRFEWLLAVALLVNVFPKAGVKKIYDRRGWDLTIGL
jgi:hypothetical protein